MVSNIFEEESFISKSFIKFRIKPPNTSIEQGDEWLLTMNNLEYHCHEFWNYWIRWILELAFHLASIYQQQVIMFCVLASFWLWSISSRSFHFRPPYRWFDCLDLIWGALLNYFLKGILCYLMNIHMTTIFWLMIISQPPDYLWV